MLGILLVIAAPAPQADSLQSTGPTIITLQEALQIALSENSSVKIADKEIERAGYARKGTYSALYPSLDGSASFQRTIKKQVAYMDFDMSSILGGSDIGQALTGGESSVEGKSASDGIPMGRWNNWSAGVTAAMPLVNAQLWHSLKISDKDVELAVEKARSSRLETVNQVKQAFFTCLLAKDAFNVYRSQYENALENLEQTQRKYNAQKASELDLTRAKTNYANAIPAVYDAESNVVLSLWQLKAVMGMNLGEDIDIAGELSDYSRQMFYDIHSLDDPSLEKNSSVRQMAIQAEQLSRTIRLQKAASLPSLSLGFHYSVNAANNDFNFSEYKWSPYSYAGLSLSIPIFSGGKRSNAIKQAKVQAMQLEIQRADTERQLQIAIRQYLNAMEAAMKSLSAAQSAVESAQKAYAIASRSYNIGRSTLTDLNDAQYSLTQAQLTVSQAIYSFVSAKASLENILGKEE